MLKGERLELSKIYQEQATIYFFLKNLENLTLDKFIKEKSYQMFCKVKSARMQIKHDK